MLLTTTLVFLELAHIVRSKVKEMSNDHNTVVYEI